MKRSETRSAFLSAFYRVQAFLLSLANSDEDGRVLVSVERLDGRPPAVSMKYQLLNPSEHFKEVVEEARSVVLAGGTMAPVRPPPASSTPVRSRTSGQINDFRQQLFSYLPPDKLSIFSCSHVRRHAGLS